MACRPVDRGFCRMGETKVPFRPVKWRFARTAELKNVFHPVKGGFGRRKSISMTFRPPKGGFGRTKLLITKVQAQASRPIELGAALFSNVHSLFMTLFHFLQQSTFVFARSKVRPRTDPHTVMLWKRKHNTARELRFDVLRTSSLRPFHRFLRPATRNLSPADTYPLYQERTSVRRPGRVFCGSKIWKGR